MYIHVHVHVCVHCTYYMYMYIPEICVHALLYILYLVLSATVCVVLQVGSSRQQDVQFAIAVGRMCMFTNDILSVFLHVSV